MSFLFHLSWELFFLACSLIVIIQSNKSSSFLLLILIQFSIFMHRLIFHSVQLIRNFQWLAYCLANPNTSSHNCNPINFGVYLVAYFLPALMSMDVITACNSKAYRLFRLRHLHLSWNSICIVMSNSMNASIEHEWSQDLILYSYGFSSTTLGLTMDPLL